VRFPIKSSFESNLDLVKRTRNRLDKTFAGSANFCFLVLRRKQFISKQKGIGLRLVNIREQELDSPAIYCSRTFMFNIKVKVEGFCDKPALFLLDFRISRCPDIADNRTAGVEQVRVTA
jgi:hypothetical protein